MAERKNATINFYHIGTAFPEAYGIIKDNLTAMVSGEMNHGVFDGKSCELAFNVHAGIEAENYTLFLVSIIKERVFLPVVFNRECGDIKEPELNQDSMGDIAYALIDPDRQAILTIGGNVGMFSDFLRWLTGDSAIGTSPIFVGNVLNQVNDWEIFRKVNVAIEAPAVDFVDNIIDSDLGENFKMLETLSGLRIEITVSMGHSKGSLHKDAVKDFIKLMMNGENPTNKLKVAGKCFEDLATAEIDLYNARLKHKTEIVIAGSHVSPDEARSTLYEAYQLHLDDIEANVEGDEK